jgi:hypothetical protein
MMSSKKAVTDIILAIGIIVAILLVFIVGMRVFSIVVKETPQFLAKEMSTTANAALAAPEDVEIANTLPKERTEGFLGLKRKSWAGVIDPGASQACAQRLEEDTLKTLFTVLGGPLAIGLSIKYEGDEVAIAGFDKKFKCKGFVEDSYAEKGSNGVFTGSLITTRYYNETTNTTSLGVKE